MCEPMSDLVLDAFVVARLNLNNIACVRLADVVVNCAHRGSLPHPPSGPEQLVSRATFTRPAQGSDAFRSTRSASGTSACRISAGGRRDDDAARHSPVRGTLLVDIVMELRESVMCAWTTWGRWVRSRKGCCPRPT